MSDRPVRRPRTYLNTKLLHHLRVEHDWPEVKPVDVQQIKELHAFDHRGHVERESWTIFSGLPHYHQ